VVWPERLLVALQRPLVHLLGLGQPALVSVEVSKVVENATPNHHDDDDDVHGCRWFPIGCSAGPM
jgi:hypothetical protein